MVCVRCGLMHGCNLDDSYVKTGEDWDREERTGEKVGPDMLAARSVVPVLPEGTLRRVAREQEDGALVYRRNAQLHLDVCGGDRARAARR